MLRIKEHANFAILQLRHAMHFAYGIYDFSLLAPSTKKSQFQIKEKSFDPESLVTRTRNALQTYASLKGAKLSFFKAVSD